MERMQRYLEKWSEEGLNSLYPEHIKLTVGKATCGVASGAEEVYRALLTEVEGRCLPVTVSSTGCLGFCQQEPLFYVHLPGSPRYIYGRIGSKEALTLLDEALKGELSERRLIGKVSCDELLLKGRSIDLTKRAGDRLAPATPETDGTDFQTLKNIPFYSRQVRIATRNCGYIDPFNIKEYIARGGYSALCKALTMKPEEVLEEVTRSGLRGRGGAGFSTGQKWSFTRQSPGEIKYVICNADEGDPGAYMDRSILEGDPHTVLEGMAIGGYAIGAQTGIIYVRSEYPLAVLTIKEAIRQAEELGLLGENIFGSGFSFRILVVKGQGAFVCGEETALIASIEGKMGEPRPRPPFPAQKGLYLKPTCINNVETWANIPPIVMLGSSWFAGLGTQTSKGTKVFALVGDVRNNGLVEVPMGTTLRQMVYDIGGGTGSVTLKAVQTGGPSGGCLPADLIDIPVDYEALNKAGSIMGSGGMVVMNERSCMVDVARFFLGFIQEESCGKCLPCREGTARMLQILNDICRGEASEDDLKLLEDLALTVKGTSLCGLGQTAPNPVLSTLKYFRNEYEKHIKEHFCPAGVCQGLFRLCIDNESCTGCGRCVKECPQEAIFGDKETGFHIKENLCTCCRACLLTCRNGAVKVIPREEDN